MVLITFGYKLQNIENDLTSNIFFFCFYSRATDWMLTNLNKDKTLRPINTMQSVWQERFYFYIYVYI